MGVESENGGGPARPRTAGAATALDAAPALEAAPVGQSTGAEHRAHLDGVRALAVYLVVAFHAGVGQLSGGFVGVDVFFVLSGYLVTGLLLRDLGSGGRVDLFRFYARRARRLLPAAGLTLVATAVVYPMVATPAEVADSRSTLWSGAAGVANWVFLDRSTDYFAADVAADPVLHFWSLAVEEQFYLLWPLALLGLWRLTRRSARPRRALGAVLLAGAAAGAAWALVVAAGSPTRAHFATDARAYQLLAGGALALVPLAAARRGRAIGAVVGLLGVLATASPRLDLGPTTRGLVVTGATVVLLASLDAGPSAVRWVLARPTIAKLGQISYGTYLWHWLVVIVLGRTLELTDLERAVATAVVATALAALSAQLVELPIRTSPLLDRRARRVLVVAVAGQVLLAAVALPALSDRAAGGETTTQAVSDDGPASGGSTGGTAASAIDWEAARDDRERFSYCRASDVAECTVVEGTGTHVALMGDSHAEMLVPALLAVAEEADLTVSFVGRSTCPWMRGVAVLIDGARECLDRQDEWYDEILPALDPDVVLVAHRAVDDPVSPISLMLPDGSVSSIDQPEHGVAAADAVEAGLADLTELAKVLVVEPLPLAENESPPVECLSRAEVVDECRFVASPGPTPLEAVEREAAARFPGEAVAADLDRLACPYLPICDPVVDGDVVLRDDTHLTASRARAIGPALLTLLDDNGWLR